VKGTSVEPLLGYLRGIGVLPQQRADGRASTAGVLLQEYDRYLRVERRAGEVTFERMCHSVRCGCVLTDARSARRW
jgi:hypothetical protein